MKTFKASCFEMNEKLHPIDQVSLEGGVRDSPGKMFTINNRPFYSCLLSCLALKTFCFSYVNAALMLISTNLHKKSSEASIKTRSPPASFSFKGQATKHTIVKIMVYYSLGCS